jgi:uncharacterized protein
MLSNQRRLVLQRTGLGLLGAATAAGAASVLGGCANKPPVSARTLKLATGAAGGGFADFGKAMTLAFEQADTPLRVQAVATSGTGENLRLLEAGEVDVALAVMGIAFDAWHGTGTWGQPAAKGLRALVPMYETSFHTAVLQSSALRSLTDLAGKRIGMGPSGGTAEVFVRGLFEQLKLSAEWVFGTPNAMADQLAQGEIDAFWFGAGLPVPAFVRAASLAPVRVLGLTTTEAAVLRRRFPFFTPFSIPAGTYAGQSETLASAAVWNFVLARDDLQVAQAHELVRVLFAQRAGMSKTYAAADGVHVGNLGGNSFLPFHAGAIAAIESAGGKVATFKPA